MAVKDVESKIEVDAGDSETTNSIMRLHEVAIADAGGSLEGLRTETLEDHINLVNRLRLKLLEKGGVEAIISKMYGDAATDPDLFFKVRRDESNMVIGLFWCDSRMRDDYKIHGDVIVFGMSYSNNRYNLICAPFVGVIKPCKNVMFGCAFIADEKTDSFVWLLDTFKKAMSNICPTIIFSEHDYAIANAIRQVFPQAKHIIF